MYSNLTSPALSKHRGGPAEDIACRREDRRHRQRLADPQPIPSCSYERQLRGTAGFLDNYTSCKSNTLQPCTCMYVFTIYIYYNTDIGV